MTPLFSGRWTFFFLIWMLVVLKNLSCVCVCVCTQMCPILYNRMDYSLPGSSVHVISQARILEWVAILFSPGDLPNPGIEPASLGSPVLAGRFFTAESPGKPEMFIISNLIISLIEKVAFWWRLCDCFWHSPPQILLFLQGISSAHSALAFCHLPSEMFPWAPLALLLNHYALKF